MSSGTLKAGVDMASQVDVIESSGMSGSSSPDASSVDVKTRSFDSAAVFDSPLRKPLKINPFFAAFNITLAFGLIGALIAGYCIGLRVFDLDITAVGLYGTILISEYLVQLCCAIINRFDIDRIVNNLAKKRANAQAAGDCEKAADGTPEHNLLNPGSEVSIAVVGYREDEQAWRLCLRSLQTQSLRPKCVIGVVDGNEEPDLNMAQAFVEEFESYKAPLIHLPLLLSEVHRKTYFDNIPVDTRFALTKFWHYLVGRYRPGHEAALAIARQVVIEQVMEWDEKWNISSLKAVMFSQPHGHKRTAMFTAFAMSLYACRTRDSIFTTDSDTLIQPNGLDEMLALLRSAPQIGGVTADVKIWNRAESLLARLCSARYWFAFNIERACQSLWRCVGCLSGPMSMYRASDLETILGPWNLQTFGGKETTFGDDRHLTNQLLAHGLRTRYTHRTWCDSESPTSFVRWVAQQTRWSKSFFREAFWFPATFALQSPWMLVETTVQALYPFILIATVFHFLFDTTSDDPWRPIIWLVTMFGVAFVKSALAVLISRDLWLLLFSAYGFIYFFGLLPSKIYALITMNQTSWGTSARSSTERKRGQSFLQRSFHICHLVIWYTAVFVGIGFFTYRIFGNPLLFLIGAFALIPSALLYWERSLSLDGLKGLFRKKKPAPEPVTPFEVDESVLPTKPSPASKSQGDLSVASTHRSSDSTLKNTPAMSVNEVPDKTEKSPDKIEEIPKAATSD
ncbi:Hyaluronan synthase 2 [Ilyonectria robusta]